MWIEVLTYGTFKHFTLYSSWAVSAVIIDADVTASLNAGQGIDSTQRVDGYRLVEVFLNGDVLRSRDIHTCGSLPGHKADIGEADSQAAKAGNLARSGHFPSADCENCRER